MQSHPFTTFWKTRTFTLSQEILWPISKEKKDGLQTLMDTSLFKTEILTIGFELPRPGQAFPKPHKCPRTGGRAFRSPKRNTLYCGSNKCPSFGPREGERSLGRNSRFYTARGEPGLG